MRARRPHSVAQASSLHFLGCQAQSLKPGFWAVVLVLVAGSACAGEAFLAADFKNLDLGKLPEGWELKGTTAPADISIADDPAKGKVLRICHKGGGCPALEIKLDIVRVRGVKVRASVLAKCPASYKPVPEKQGAPQLSLSCLAKGGQTLGMVSSASPDNLDWQNVAASYDVPADAEALTVSLRIVEVAADVCFDALRVEVEGSPPAQPVEGPPLPPSKGVQPAATPPAPAGQAAPAATVAAPAKPKIVPTGAAATAPSKSMENDGLVFSPEIAAVLAAARKKGAAERSYAVVGPGAQLLDSAAKPFGKWTRIAVSKDMSGTLAAPENLVSSLPGFVVAQKPEIVIVAGGACEARKLAYHESCDYEDLARICLRFGVMPVLAVPPAGPLDDLRTEMLEAAKAANCPAVEPKSPAQAPVRILQVLGLLERHVLERAPATEAAKAGAKSQPAEE